MQIYTPPIRRAQIWSMKTKSTWRMFRCVSWFMGQDVYVFYRRAIFSFSRLALSQSWLSVNEYEVIWLSSISVSSISISRGDARLSIFVAHHLAPLARTYSYLLRSPHQNLTYEPQAEQELCVYQDTLVHPGITFAIVHHFTRSSMYSSTHFIPKHIITYVLIHINTHLHPWMHIHVT